MDKNDLLRFVLMAGMTLIFIWSILHWRKMTYKSRLQNKLLDKFGTGPELNEFLQSSGGNRFMSFLTSGGQGAKENLISGVSKGIITTILGVALLVAGPFMATDTEGINMVHGIGIAVILLGIGFLIATFVSYILSKKWGLMDSE